MARNFKNYGRKAYTRARSYGQRAYSGFRSYGGRAYGYARRGGAAAVRYNRRAVQGFGPDGFKIYPDASLAAGVAVGLTNIDRKIPGEIILAGAALPIGGKYGRQVRNFFGGIVLGELISKFTGVNIPFPSVSETEAKKNMSVAALYSA